MKSSYSSATLRSIYGYWWFQVLEYLHLFRAEYLLTDSVFATEVKTFIKQSKIGSVLISKATVVYLSALNYYWLFAYYN